MTGIITSDKKGDLVGVPCNKRNFRTLQLKIPVIGRSGTGHQLHSIASGTHTGTFFNSNALSGIGSVPPGKAAVFQTRHVEQITAGGTGNNFRGQKTVQITGILIGVPYQGVAINMKAIFLSLGHQCVNRFKVDFATTVHHGAVLHVVTNNDFPKVVVHNAVVLTRFHVAGQIHPNPQIQIGIGCQVVVLGNFLGQTKGNLCGGDFRCRIALYPFHLGIVAGGGH